VSQNNFRFDNLRAARVNGSADNEGIQGSVHVASALVDMHCWIANLQPKTQ